MELQFINIRPNFRATPEDMEKPIVGIYHEGVLYPLDDKPDAKEMFIYGVGWKKIGKSKRYAIPRFSMRSEDWQSYRNLYGDHILFYSLTNSQLNSGDCCDYCARQEFLSIRNKDLVHYMGFVKLWCQFNELQQKRLMEIYPYDKNGWLRGRKSIRPSFGWGFITFDPSMNPIDNDKLLWEHQCELFHRKCKEQGVNVSLTHLLLGFDHPEYDVMKDFPVSVHDRMLHVFGEEMTELYEKLLKYYTK